MYFNQGQINLSSAALASGQNHDTVCAVVNDAAANCLDVPIQTLRPDIFLLPGNHAAALNEDGKINSAQAVSPTGSMVSLFLTGWARRHRPPRMALSNITPYPAPVRTSKLRSFLPGTHSASFMALPSPRSPTRSVRSRTPQDRRPQPDQRGCAPLQVLVLTDRRAIPSLFTSKGGLSVAIEVLPPGGGPPIR